MGQPTEHKIGLSKRRLAFTDPISKLHLVFPERREGTLPFGASLKYIVPAVMMGELIDLNGTILKSAQGQKTQVVLTGAKGGYSTKFTLPEKPEPPEPPETQEPPELPETSETQEPEDSESSETIPEDSGLELVKEEPAKEEKPTKEPKGKKGK
jgi:hypothetical protein